MNRRVITSIATIVISFIGNGDFKDSLRIGFELIVYHDVKKVSFFWNFFLEGNNSFMPAIIIIVFIITVYYWY